MITLYSFSIEVLRHFQWQLFVQDDLVPRVRVRKKWAFLDKPVTIIDFNNRADWEGVIVTCSRKFSRFSRRRKLRSKVWLSCNPFGSGRQDALESARCICFSYISSVFDVREKVWYWEEMFLLKRVLQAALFCAWDCSLARVVLKCKRICEYISWLFVSFWKEI